MHALWAQALMSIAIVIIIPWHLIFSLVSLVMVVGGSLTVYSLYVLLLPAWQALIFIQGSFSKSEPLGCGICFL